MGLKAEDPNKPYIPEVFGNENHGTDQVIDALLMQYGKPHFILGCDIDRCDNSFLFGEDYRQTVLPIPACCWTHLTNLLDVELVLSKSSDRFEKTVADLNPSGSDLLRETIDKISSS